jgi:ABC-type uncharacterized transport system substrate-binding protein
MKRRLLPLLVCAGLFALSPLAVAADPVKILHVMSYRSDWQWNKDQLKGFLDGLAIPNAEVKVVELDAKHADPAKMKAAAASAVELMQSWKPDLVYTNDDVAQAEFSVKFINAKTPIVYSGVNKAPSDYGFDTSSNITGVLEREHFIGTLSLLREIKPSAKLRVALVLDDDPTWAGVAARIRTEVARRSDVEVVEWLTPKTFDEYKARVTALQGQVDALGLIGIFRFAKADGKFADYEEVQRWNVEHSKLPDFSFWDTRVERGTLCAMTVDGLEQGRLAGRMARRILVDKVAPTSITPEPTAKGRPMISLARARQLGIPIGANVLLASTVLPRYHWER